MPKAAVFLLVLLVAASAPVALANRRDRCTVCHLNRSGDYTLVRIPSWALRNQLADGDIVVGADVALDCNLHAPWAQSGCFPLRERGDYYFLTDGTLVQDMGGQQLYQAGCDERVDARFVPDAHLVWAVDRDAATAVCSALGLPKVTVEDTPHLYICCHHSLRLLLKRCCFETGK